MFIKEACCPNNLNYLFKGKEYNYFKETVHLEKRI